MRALLEQQLEAEALFEEVEDDEDFAAVEEEDIVDSDFDSTDEEDEGDDEEHAIVEAEKAARKKVKQKAALAFTPVRRGAPRSATKHVIPSPLASNSKIGPGSKSTPPPTKKRKQVSIESPMLSGPRQSGRASTVASKRLLEQKLKEDMYRRSIMPKKQKIVEVELTQEEKLAEAVETERINTESLRTLQQLEEENKRKLARKVVPLVGPMIQFRSFREPVRSDGQVPQISDDEALLIDVDDETAQIYAEVGADGPLEAEGRSAKISGEGMQPMDVDAPDGDNTTSTGAQTELDREAGSEKSKEDGVERTLVSFLHFTEDPFEKWARKPSRPEKSLCPITGLPARFKDPKTNVPYATKEAYSVIQQIAQQHYAWSPIVHAYVHPANARAPRALVEAMPQWLDTTVGEVFVDDSIVADGPTEPLVL
ncbi:Vacuolar protein sorting-associated protein 72 [Borealophlyctis nickersoniae]|nr:Vacuolar protein sorting-associated protein 72 [Borealophlyctis nickersoniae]